ncbi:phosphopantetheine attachment site family protein [Streptomyces globisporus]|uniref:Phosphopantetheine attachment site family protein n=2 Tax=Streptomyces globisporus TaxID=1908 RepID=A0A423V4D7_STRGL|nr:phosphopantetheine attachment site family protein [Streptomyces globisporus]
MDVETVTPVEDDTVAKAATVVRNYVRSNMSALRDEDLHDEDNIFEKGFVTSIFAMQLLDFIETTFDVEVPDDRITLQNFSSVQRISRMVGELKNA